MKENLQAKMAKSLAESIDKNIVDYSTEIEEAIKENAALRERIGVLGECLHLQSENLQELHSVKHLVEHAQEGVEKCFEKIEDLKRWVNGETMLPAIHSVTSRIEILENLFSGRSFKPIHDALETHIEKFNERISVLEKALDNYREYKTGIEDLETDVMYLKEEVKKINGQKFSEFHHLTPRVERLESERLGQELDPKVWKFLHERVDKLEGMTDFKKVEACLLDGAQTHLSILKCQGELKKLREDFENKLDVDYKKWIAYFSQHPSQNKKPHKCPICNGYGNCTRPNLQDGGEFNHQCNSCKGEGIVWG